MSLGGVSSKSRETVIWTGNWEQNSTSTTSYTSKEPIPPARHPNPLAHGKDLGAISSLT